jgi:hypothetical protein
MIPVAGEAWNVEPTGVAGGAFIPEGGRALRPVQDESRICSGRFGCQTYNRSAGLEVIGLFGKPGARRKVAVPYCGDGQTDLPLAQDVMPVLGDRRQQVADDPA